MQNRIVRKSNSLIEASYRLSPVEQKIILFLVSNLKVSDEDFQSYPIRIKDFQEFLGNSSVHYERIEDLLVSLKEKNLRIVYVSDGEKIILNVSWLSSCEYTVGSGVVKLSFDPKLKPFLLQLKNRFTKYQLKNIVQLRSQFSIRIYELLKQYEGIGKRDFSIFDLREVLGIGESQYKLYSDFKRKVILIAQEELAEKTDISFDFEEIKVGRGVGKIRFIIGHNAKNEILDNFVTDALISAEAQLDELSILVNKVPPTLRNKESLRNLLKLWLSKKGFEYVARNIEYANDSSNEVKPGTNLSKGSNYRSYLAKSLRDDYGLPYYEDREAKKALEEKARLAKIAEEKLARETSEKLQRDQEDVTRAKIFLSSLAPETIESIRIEALNRLTPEEQALVSRQATGAELLLKITMNRIALERMKIFTESSESVQPHFSAETANCSSPSSDNENSV